MADFIDSDDFHSSIELFDPSTIDQGNKNETKTDLIEASLNSSLTKTNETAPMNTGYDRDKNIKNTTSIQDPIIDNIQQKLPLQTLCPRSNATEVHQESLVEEVVAFLYSLQTSRHADLNQEDNLNNIAISNEQKQVNLVNTMEILIHNVTSNLVLAHCLEKNNANDDAMTGLTLFNIDENSLINEANAQEVLSTPLDTIISNDECETNDKNSNELKECLVVKSQFTVVFPENLSPVEIESAKSKLLESIESTMSTSDFKDYTNEQLISRISNNDSDPLVVTSMAYLSNPTHTKASRNIALIVSTVVILVLLILLFFAYIIFRKRRQEEHSKLTNELEVDIAKIVNDDYSTGESNSEVDVEESMEAADSSYELNRTSSDVSVHSISSVSASTMHSVDVHKCSSAYCLICQKAGRTPQFRNVESSSVQTVEFVPKPDKDWWKNL